MKRFLFSIGLALLGQVLLAQSPTLTFTEILSLTGDGCDDRFVITGLTQYPFNKLTIYTRWGQEVYSASPYRNDWDGTSVPASPKSKRKSKRMPLAPEPLPVGTYHYVLEVAHANPGHFKGFLTIVP